MSHSKSVSWHVSSPLDFTLDPPSVPTSTSTSNMETIKSPQNPSPKRKSTHTPSLSVSSDISFYSPVSSPTKRHRRNINPTPIVSPTKELQFDSIDDLTAPGLGSPTYFNYREGEDHPGGGSGETITSPYILESQPNLQDVFISLANKERRVLEAKEQLRNAQNELSDFKNQWSSVLNIPSPSSSTIGSRSKTPSPFTTPLRSQGSERSKRRASSLSNSSIDHAASLRGSIGRSGLNIMIPGMENDNDYVYEENVKEEDYLDVCERANEIDYINSTANTFTTNTTASISTRRGEIGFLQQIKNAIKGTIHLWRLAFSPAGASDPIYQAEAVQKADRGVRNRRESGSLTKSYYQMAMGHGRGVKFPRLPVVDRYIKSVC